MYTVHFKAQPYKNTVCMPHLQVRYCVVLQREHAFNKLLPHKGTAHLKRPVYYLHVVMPILHQAYSKKEYKGKKGDDVKITDISMFMKNYSHYVCKSCF